MTSIENQSSLAALSAEATSAWERFAEENDVTVGSLLEALAPILLASTPATLDLRAALIAAVEAARAAALPSSLTA